MKNVRQEKMRAVLGLRQPDFSVVMENVFNPHNISAVMRSCDSVGIGEIHVLNTRIPPHNGWGFRSSAGSWKWIKASEYSESKECLEALRARYKRIYAAQPGPDALDLYKVDFTGPVAIVFGNEQKGCSPEVLAACDGTICIPQVGMAQSLNISVACAVILYEAFRQKLAAGHYDALKMSQLEIEGILNEWTDFRNVRMLKTRKP